MNKLLFYIDFVSFREHGMAISGLPYRALEFGPVPERWDRIYSQFDNITQVPTLTKDSVGTILQSAEPANLSSRLSLLSHNEPGWLNHNENHSAIPFIEAFQIKAL